ncbi:MAG: beta-N-acetylhexosaminidase [Pseudomonadota bacterium]
MRDAASAVVIAAVEGLELTPDEERFFKEESPAGVTLFRRNFPQDNFQNVARLNASLQASRGSGAPPMVIAIDQEGGRVSRIAAPFPNLGPAMAIEDGRFDRSALTRLRQYGQDVGRSLRDIGINVDFAPVLDVLTEATNLAIGDRCFGTTPEQVTPRAEAFMSGLHSERVMGCLKHFPGQGDARVDTHQGTAVIDVSLQTLITRELVPFKALATKCPMVMISHSIFPVLDDLEASRSRIIIMDWLRARLGFEGVVVSDDMNMGALPQQIAEWKNVLIDTVAAGCDALLVCRHLDRCYAALDALRAEAKKSPAFSARLDDAARRVTSMRHALI